MDDFEIFLDGVYGLEITYQDYVAQLSKAAGKDILHRMNTPGGDVAEATAMRNALEGYMKKYPDAKIAFAVEGWVQSAGTYHASVKGATVTVSPDSLFMYHNPQSVAFGDHVAMEQKMNFLRDMAGVYAQAYSARSGKSIEDTHTEMDAETYFIGQSIVDAGFADAVEGEAPEETMRAESVVVALGRERFKQTIGRLAAAAYGAKQTNELRPGTPVVDDNNTTGDTEMSEKNKTETVKLDVSMETKRAQAWMDATRAEPNMAAALKQKFVDGASAEFFSGIVAAAEMRAASESETAAAGETQEIGEVNTGEQNVTMSANPKTPGATGETAEV